MGGKDACKGLLYLTFCIYLIREKSGNSQGILKSDACGNHASPISDYLP